MFEFGNIILLDSVLDISDIVELQRLEWIPSDYNIKNALFEKKDVWTLSGLDISKTFSEHLSIDRPCLLFTNLYFSIGGDSFVENDACAITSAHWDHQLPIKFRFVLNVLKWTLSRYHKCEDKNCLISDNHNPEVKHICLDCKKILCDEENKDLLFIVLAAEALYKNASIIENYLSKPISQSLHELNVNSAIPYGNILITKKIIDYQAAPTSQDRKWLYEISEKIYNNKDKIKDEYTKGPSRKPKYPTIIAARRWNSWTPARPTGVVEGNKLLGHKTGGGYYISDGITNIAIDPGYGYLEMLYDFHGLTVCDIDAVIITHDHPDHSAELSNIFTLRHEYNDSCNPLIIFMNGSSYYLHEHLCQYHSHILSPEGPTKMLPLQPYKIGKFTIKAIGMQHRELIYYCEKEEVKEIVGESIALGLSITCETEHSTKGFLNFAIVGDTAFPKEPEICNELFNFFNKPDIAALHLGSIEKKWSEIPYIDSSKVEYGEMKHLGINGCIKMISLLQPKVSIITEFGEELDTQSHRITIRNLIKNIINNSESIILPSDIGLSLVIKDAEIYCQCMACKKYVPIKSIHIQDDNSFLVYSYEAGCSSGHDHFDL